MGSNALRLAGVEDRLHCWKEIAAFLGRGVRTVQRWEMERDLPIHRLPGGKMGSVYALKSELAEWMAGAEQNGQSAAHPAPSQVLVTKETGAEIQSLAAPGEPVPAAPPQVVAAIALEHNSFAHRAWAISGTVAAVCLLSAAVFLLMRTPSLIGRPAVATSPHLASQKATQLYVQGRFYWEKRTPADLQRAIDLFTQAIVEDPSYAQPYSGIADCYNLLREFSSMPPEEAYPRAIAAASRAVQLDDTSSEAHSSLAFATLYWKWDWEAAEREFQRAIQLNPNSATAHHWYANGLRSRGRVAEALQEIETAERLDPTAISVLSSKGLILIAAGRKAEGKSLLQRIETEHSDYLPAHDYLSQMYLADAATADYLSEEKRLVAITGSNSQRVILAAARHGASTAGYAGMLREMLQASEGLPEGSRDPYSEARLHAMLGDRSRAMELLELAYRKHRPGICFLQADQQLASLRDDAEFRELATLHYRPAQKMPMQMAPMVAMMEQGATGGTR